MTVLKHENIRINVKKRVLREDLGHLGLNSLKIVNETDENMDKLMELASDLFPYSQERLEFDRPVGLKLRSDLNNAGNPLGKTAYYDPGNDEIVIFVDNRHPKDILRSLSHELVHHAQNCRGQFNNTLEAGEGYAQKNEHLREMEQEAYLEGNMIIRDWEDSIKEDNKMLSEDKIREMVRKGLKKVLFEKEELKEDDNPEKEKCAKAYRQGGSETDYKKCLKAAKVEEGSYYKRDDDSKEGGDPGEDQRKLSEGPNEEEEVVKEVTVESRLRVKNNFLFEKLTRMWTKK